MRGDRLRAVLLYVTPERFRDRDFFAMLRERGVSLLVVDEAHCVSHWGRDPPPPDYLTLGDIADRLERPPVLALTATAPPDVQADITRQLGLREPLRTILDPSRPNLFFEVLKVPSPEKKDEIFEDALDGCEGTGIVYVATVKEAERLWERYRDRWPLAIYGGRYPAIEETAAIVGAILILLKRAGAVREHRGGGWSRAAVDVTRVDLSAALDEWDERRDLDRERLGAMVRYCRSAQCRTRYLLEYLGATVADDFACGHCDNDLIPDAFMPTWSPQAP